MFQEHPSALPSPGKAPDALLEAAVVLAELDDFHFAGPAPLLAACRRICRIVYDAGAASPEPHDSPVDPSTRGMPLIDRMFALLPGFGWCGDCGTPTRLLAEADVDRLFDLGIDHVAAWGSRLEVFQAVGRIMEIDQRGRADGTCTCHPASEEPPRSGFYLYRLWNHSGRLLYVGVSTALAARIRTHRRRWGSLIVRVTWQEYPDAEAMLDAESIAISEECPALNKAGS